MIKLFRKIRQKMFIKNKMSKYLFYAFGEIFLVVIGILIALQINNWNQTRIENDVEIALLKSCKEGLLKDLADIELNMSIHKKGITAANFVIGALASSAPYNVDTVAKKNG